MNNITPVQNTNNIRIADFVRVTTPTATYRFSTAPTALTISAVDSVPFSAVGSLVSIGNVQRDIKSTGNDTTVTFIGLDTALLGWVLPPKVNWLLIKSKKRDTVWIYSMTGLTRKQQQILDFIQKWQRTEGTTPTFREIADQFGFRSLNSVTEHVRLLRNKGVLVTEPGKARSLRVVSPLAKLRGRIVDIPLFGSIPAGLPQAREQDAEGCVSVDVESLGFKPTRNSFALRVTGDSMIGRHILAGDVIVLEHGPDPRNGQVVAALIDGESTLKTFVLKGGRPFLRAENPKYPDLIPAQELMIQGVFRALVRKASE